jgi:hypothetical protein
MVAVPPLFLAAVPAAAAEVHGPTADRLVSLERSTWHYYKAKDEAALRRLAPADFADLYLDGTIVGRERWLKDMHDVEVLGSELKSFHVFRLTPDSYVVTYEARARGRTANIMVETHVGVTSAWVRRGGRWANPFYEENALEPVKRTPLSPPSASLSPRRR